MRLHTDDCTDRPNRDRSCSDSDGTVCLRDGDREQRQFCDDLDGDVQQPLFRQPIKRDGAGVSGTSDVVFELADRSTTEWCATSAVRQ